VLRILITEGLSLSARQTLSALGPLKHQIDVLDPNPLFCIARHSRFVRRCIRVPSFGRDPWGYSEALKEQLQRTHYDVLFPTHDQVYLLAAMQSELKQWTNLAVPPFESIQQVQSKARFVETLQSLNLPHPVTRDIQSFKEQGSEREYPFFVKLPYSTAGQGVWRVGSEQDRSRVFEQLHHLGALSPESDVLVQQLAPGTLSVVQSVFQHGELIAYHCYQARQLGVGGSAVAKISVHHPEVKEDIQKLGRHLNWHGALMLDYLYDEKHGPSYIDCNPRIGETYNATLSGTSLCDCLLRVSLDQPCQPYPDSKVGIKTHSVMLQMLASMLNRPSRVRLLKELQNAWSNKGIYADSQDEITPIYLDGRSLFPAMFVAAQLLLSPSKAQRLTSSTVQNYSLDAQTVRSIQIPNGAR
jgi:predicted ATP-grasp superfamily ATP-dependent carboligase